MNTPELIHTIRMQGGDTLPARVLCYRWLYTKTARRISRGDRFTLGDQAYQVIAVLATHSQFQKYEVARTLGFL